MSECKTKEDASERMSQARLGSLVEPTEEYLLELRRQGYNWINLIEDTLAKIQLDKNESES